jgi:hypothetical protein
MRQRRRFGHGIKRGRLDRGELLKYPLPLAAESPSVGLCPSSFTLGTLCGHSLVIMRAGALPPGLSGRIGAEQFHGLL